MLKRQKRNKHAAEDGVMGRLDYCLYLIPKLSIENLKRKEAFVLMENLSSNLHLSLAAKRKLFEEVFRISKGNPGIISKISERAQSPEYQRDNRLNLALIMIDSEIEGIV